MFGKIPLVSIVIPYYDHKGWLLEALDSVKQQSYANFEVILIDDGSKDPLSDFELKKYSDLKIKYIIQSNQGPGAARNRGIDLATGEYVAFLDSDDLWLPDKLHQQINFMLKKNSEWTCESYQTFGLQHKKIDCSLMDGDVYLKTITSSRIATPSVIIKSSVLRENPTIRFSEKMLAGEDMYFWMLMALKYPIHYCDTANTLVRLHGSNAAKQVKTQLKVRADIYQLMRNNEEIFRWNQLNPSLRFAYQLAFKNYLKYKQGNETSIKGMLYYLIPWILFKYNSRN